MYKHSVLLPNNKRKIKTHESFNRVQFAALLFYIQVHIKTETAYTRRSRLQRWWFVRPVGKLASHIGRLIKTCWRYHIEKDQKHSSQCVVVHYARLCFTITGGLCLQIIHAWNWLILAVFDLSEVTKAKPIFFNWNWTQSWQLLIKCTEMLL